MAIERIIILIISNGLIEADGLIEAETDLIITAISGTTIRKAKIVNGLNSFFIFFSILAYY